MLDKRWNLALTQQHIRFAQQLLHHPRRTVPAQSLKQVVNCLDDTQVELKVAAAQTLSADSDNIFQSFNNISSKTLLETKLS